jgi:hypothetical protein
LSAKFLSSAPETAILWASKQDSEPNVLQQMIGSFENNGNGHAERDVSIHKLWGICAAQKNAASSAFLDD